jgi:hypothetical protein
MIHPTAKPGRWSSRAEIYRPDTPTSRGERGGGVARRASGRGERAWRAGGAGGRGGDQEADGGTGFALRQSAQVPYISCLCDEIAKSYRAAMASWSSSILGSSNSMILPQLTQMR